MEIFKLFGRILVENDDANRKIAETEAQAEKAGNTFRNGVVAAAKWGAGIAAAAGAAGLALFKFARSVADTSGAIDDISQRLGVSTTAFQEYQYAAEQLGISQDSMERALGRLNQRIGMAERGNTKYAAALKELGITTNDAAEAFVQAVEALHQMDDANARAAAAADLFGTQLARDLMPAIVAGGEELLNLRNRAHQLGIVMSEEAVQAGASFGDALTDMQMVLKSIRQDIANRMIPTFASWMTWMSEHLPKAWAVFEFLGEVVGIVFKYIRLMIGDAISWIQDHVIGPFSEWLVSVWSERGPPIVAAVEALWDGVKAVFVAVFELIKGIWEAFILAFHGDWAGAWGKVKETFSNLWSQIPDMFAGIWEPLVSIADQLMTAVIDVIRAVFGDEVAHHFQSIWEAVLAVFEVFTETFMGVWRALSALFRGDWETAWAEIKTVAENIWNTIPVVFEEILNALIGIADTVMTAVIAVLRARFGDNVADIFQMAWDAVKAVFEGARDILLGIWTALNAAFRGDWEGAWAAIQDVIRIAWDTIETVVTAGLDIIRTIIDAALNGIVALVRWAFGDEAATAVDQAFNVIRDIIDGICEVILGIIRTFAALFRGDWDTAWNEAKNVIQTAWNTIELIVDGALTLIKTIINGALDGIVALVRWAFGDEAANAVDEAFNYIRGIVNNVCEIILGIIRTFSALFRGDWQAAWDEAKKTVQAAWDTIGKIVEVAMNAVNSAVDGALGGIVSLIRMLFGDDAADAVDQAFDSIRIAVDTATEVILGIVRTFSALFRGDWQAAWDEVKNIASTIWNALPQIFEAAIGGLVAIADVIMRAVIGVIRDVFGDEVADHFEGIWGSVKLIFQTAKDAILGIWRAFSALFRGDWETAWAEVRNVFATIWTAIPAIIEGILDGMFGIVDSMVRAIIGLIRNVFGDEIADAFQAAWDTATIIFETTKDALLGIWRAFSALFRGDWEGAWQGIKDVFAGIWGGIVSIFQGPLDGIRRFVVTWALEMAKWFGALKDGIVNRISGAVTGALDWFRDLKNLGLEYVMGLVEGIKEWFSETKLGKAWQFMIGLWDSVKEGARDMYDKVVGNSYVPDMVEEIGVAIQKLKEKLAQPVVRYTAEAIQAFAELEAEAVASIMSMAEALDSALESIANTISAWIGDISRAFWHGTATWAGILQTFAGTVGKAFGIVFDTITKELVKNIVKQNEWLVATMSNIATAITGLLSQAYATLVAFFAWSGPLAPALAAGVIATAIAGIASIGGNIIRGLLPDAPGGGSPDVGSGDRGGGGRSGGRQVSEITGPTRDLLVDLLSPLANFGAIVAPIQDIRNILYERMPNFNALSLDFVGAGVGAMGPAVVIENLNVTAPTTGVDDISRATIDQIEKALAGRINFGIRGRGGR